MVKEEKKEENTGTGSVRIDNSSYSQALQTNQPSLVKQQSGKEDEPDFMKYIRGVNMNHDDKAYLQSHFDEEESNIEQ